MDKKWIFALLLWGLAVFPSASYAISPAAGTASLSFSPLEGRYHQGENFSVRVVVDSSVAINAVDGTFTFPTRYLQALRINKDASIVNLWVAEPSFSNAGEVGNVNFEGVILNPGFVGSSGRVIEVVFRVKNEGGADLNFTRAAILANDGLGTNITTLHSGGARYAFLAASAPKEIGGRQVPAPTGQTIVIKEIPAAPKAPEGILAWWEILPSWIKIGLMAFVGIATFIFALTVLSFGIIILIYLWKYALSRREMITRRAARGLKITWFFLKRAARRVFLFGKVATEEVAGDTHYAVQELEQDFQEVSGNQYLPLARVLGDHWFSIMRIVRRFFTMNTKIPDDAKGEDETTTDASGGAGTDGIGDPS